MYIFTDLLIVILAFLIFSGKSKAFRHISKIRGHLGYNYESYAYQKAIGKKGYTQKGRSMLKKSKYFPKTTSTC